MSDAAAPAAGRSFLTRRLVLSWFVGAAFVGFSRYPYAAALAGGWPLALVRTAVLASASMATLAFAHGVTPGSTRADRFRWGLGVTAAAFMLSALMASTWSQFGGDYFAPLLGWRVLGGGVFVLCSAAATRHTAVIARSGVLGLLVLAGIGHALG
ncbi:hypothetical protein [Pengzhenrongella sicca]|uniref:Uncharacterized protein n=1 Tax=Pengzhenrongella sicca TaxID=2819238 RepID=A0A8A4Z959_9MICO|nr:hypothetical protein [Pengzhenrongella sicca]QTE28412.1 hypothetical protein J4E96_13625 [Pengzhenrongella sicca]